MAAAGVWADELVRHPEVAELRAGPDPALQQSPDRPLLPAAPFLPLAGARARHPGAPLERGSARGRETSSRRAGGTRGRADQTASRRRTLFWHFRPSCAASKRRSLGRWRCARVASSQETLLARSSCSPRCTRRSTPRRRHRWSSSSRRASRISTAASAVRSSSRRAVLIASRWHRSAARRPTPPGCPAISLVLLVVCFYAIYPLDARASALPGSARVRAALRYCADAGALRQRSRPDARLRRHADRYLHGLPPPPAEPLRPARRRHGDPHDRAPTPDATRYWRGARPQPAFWCSRLRTSREFARSASSR